MEECWRGGPTMNIRTETQHRCRISRNALRSPSTSSSRSGNYSAMTRRWCKLPVNRFFCFPVLRLDGFTLEGQRQHEPRGEIDALHRLSRWGRFVSVVRRAIAVRAGCKMYARIASHDGHEGERLSEVMLASRVTKSTVI